MSKAIFTLSILVSAFLLFLVQPMFARMMLPYLGGSPAVWNTSLVFFQAVLLLGYAYAHWAAKNLTGKKVGVHIAIMLVGMAFLPIRVPNWGDPPTSGTPVFWLLGMLAMGVGVPFFITSSTSPLLQRWFSRLGHSQSANPYFLYAASNIGSLAALLGYPLVFEMNLPLYKQSNLWSVGFATLIFCVGCCASFFAKAEPETVQEDVVLEPIPWQRKMKWVLLAFVPSSLLMGVTTYVSTEIAAVPLLWVIPLAIYLFTFILTFADRKLIPQKLIRAIAPFFIVIPLIVTVGQFKRVDIGDWTSPWWIPIAAGFGGFFVASMLCHGELSEDKPEPARLTEFFLWVSFGGVLGGLFCGLVAPVVFKQVLEYPIALVLCAALLKPSTDKKSFWDWLLPVLTAIASAACLYALHKGGHWNEREVWRAMAIPGILCVLAYARPARLATSVAILAAAPLFFGPIVTSRMYQSRGFFGTLIVRSNESERTLLHGTTLHGQQPLSPSLALIPSSYYHQTGPCGDILEKRKRPENAHIGVVGLGVGTLLAYSRPGEEWTIFEIDPEIVKIASDPHYFTYLSSAKGKWKVSLGDARLNLEHTTDTFDVLLMDAYSSDAVPIHLITVEAIRGYLKRLKPGGLLAIHISNRYMDLWPVFAAAAKELNLVERRRYDVTENELLFPYKNASNWLVLAPKESDLGSIAIDPNWMPDETPSGFLPWTDDRSSILTVLKDSPWNPVR